MTKVYGIESLTATENPVPGKYKELTEGAIGEPFADSTWPYSIRQAVMGRSYSIFTEGCPLISKGIFTCKSLQFILAMKNGTDLLTLGIYNSSYLLIAKTAPTLISSITGVVADLPLLTPTPIAGKSLYYLAFSLQSSAPNNTQYPVFSGGDTLTFEPRSHVSDNANSMPASIGAGSIVDQYRPWIGWSS